MLNKKKIMLCGIVLSLFAVAGFAWMTSMVKDNRGSRQLQGTYRQLAQAQAQSQPRREDVPKAAVNADVSSTVKADTRSGQHSHLLKSDDKGRDVFREFYVRHGAPGASGAKGSVMHLQQNLPDLARLLNANSGVQAMPPVQVMNAAASEQPEEVKIYGITCIGENNLFVDQCAAITSKGVLKKGDRLGNEIVADVNKTSLATGKRMFQLN
jgi:hypothetical protein